MRKQKTMLIALTLLTIASVSIAFAYTLYVNRPIAFNGIIAVSGNLQVYTDNTFTVVLTTITLPVLHHGDVSPIQTLWVKNIGDATLNLCYNFTNLPTGLTAALNYSYNTPLAPDTPISIQSTWSVVLTVVFSVDSTMPLGPFNFGANIYGTA